MFNYNSDANKHDAKKLAPISKKQKILMQKIGAKFLGHVCFKQFNLK